MSCFTKECLTTDKYYAKTPTCALLYILNNWFQSSITTINFYFTYFKDCPFRWIIFWRDVIGLYNDEAWCSITLYISYILRQVWGIWSVSVTAGSLFCCYLGCWQLGTIKLKLSNICYFPVVYKILNMFFFGKRFYAYCFIWRFINSFCHVVNCIIIRDYNSEIINKYRNFKL